MTVREMITELQRYDPNYVVVVPDNDGEVHNDFQIYQRPNAEQIILDWVC